MSRDNPYNPGYHAEAGMRRSAVNAATRVALHTLVQHPDTRVLASDEVCPKKSKVVSEILAKIAARKVQ